MIPSSRMGGGMGHSKVIPNPNPKWPHSLLPPGTAPIPCWGMLLSPPTGMMEKFRVGFGVHGQQEPQGDPSEPRRATSKLDWRLAPSTARPGLS